LLLRVLWATGARVSGVLALRPMDVQRDHLAPAQSEEPELTVKRVYLPAGQADLPGALLVWANDHRLARRRPVCASSSRRSVKSMSTWPPH